MGATLTYVGWLVSFLYVQLLLLFTSASIRFFFAALTSCDLSTNHFGPKPCLGMAAVIRNNKTLKYLDISSNALGSGEADESIVLAEVRELRELRE